ncbi:apolipoprotein N-acyltransferase [Alpinimonas psychrophila]|uniref:Apolipoprotein N-acyltransferase n=1 Tax=Alpinimonas psychrophila TaxID=748908 RepID=A0A7W3PNH6_9MICO|nr:apolipoprotein N-acyltransferase [Alpinimonas psychrophila]
MTALLRPLTLWLALIVAAISGFALEASFPERGWWPLAFAGVILLLWSLVGRGLWTAFLIGIVAGAAFWGSLIHWLTLYLGPVPWLALAGLQTIFFGFGAMALAVVLNRGNARWPSRWGRFGLVPVVVAALFTAREAISAVWPYGGFSWGRLAHSQSEGPFVNLVAWVGTSGLSFIVALLAAILFQILRSGQARKMWPVFAVATVVALVIPPFPVQISGSTRVLAVQGNSDSGLFAQYTPGQILQDHVSETLPYAGEKIDMVIWPENASDIDPLRNTLSAQTLNYVSTALNAPIVVGTITNPEPGQYFNSSLVWQAGKGATAQYDKIHPVPFAEYMPNREFFRSLQPDLVDLVSRDYQFGTRPNVVDVAGVPAGVAICFDIADDQQAFDMIARGAQIILAQTNNADFGHTDESVQQLAIARLRAVETGRSVVNISTVGTSAIITPGGSTLNQLPTFTAGAMLNDVPLSTTITPAMAWGRTIELGIVATGLVGLTLVLIKNPVGAKKLRRRN